MVPLGTWIEAARPRTLPAALAPVLVGTAAAERVPSEMSVPRFVLALVVALALQVAVNYANDYFDGVKGVDTPDRTGPRRVVASGLVAPEQMRIAIGVALAIAAVAGLALAAMVGWELLLVGVVAILAALGYSGGSKPYASIGLGEVAVFVFFGLVATVGSQYVQDEEVAVLAVGASVPVGLLAVALLVANNLRDIPTDTAAGKRTLAVRLGEDNTRLLFQALVAGALAFLLPVAALSDSWWPLLGLLPAPMAVRAMNLVWRCPLGPGLIPALETTGRLHLVLGALLALGLVLGS
jgi:1,4-dihydroxy-2-naphthoate polyprenyltransferase